MRTEDEMRAEQAPTFDSVDELAKYIESLVDPQNDYGTCVLPRRQRLTLALDHPPIRQQHFRCSLYGFRRGGICQALAASEVDFFPIGIHIEKGRGPLNTRTIHAPSRIKEVNQIGV